MKPKMILSMPSHGTDWLAHLITQVGGFNYFDKEFFNPICNPKYEAQLATCFGCELVSYHVPITYGSPAFDGLHEKVFAETWGRESYNFDKENFSLFKTVFFARRFDCVFLYRRADSIFPPPRLRVYQWYDAIWASLKYAEASDRFPKGLLKGGLLAQRAREAHEMMWRAGFKLGEPFRIPTIDYDKLVSGSSERVLQEVNCLADWGVDAKVLRDAILETRVVPEQARNNSA